MRRSHARTCASACLTVSPRTARPALILAPVERPLMAGEQVLDTVQVHPSDWDAGTLDIGSAERDHRSEARQ
jgi:hypothetical protein